MLKLPHEIDSQPRSSRYDSGRLNSSPPYPLLHNRSDASRKRRFPSFVTPTPSGFQYNVPSSDIRNGFPPASTSAGVSGVGAPKIDRGPREQASLGIGITYTRWIAQNCPTAFPRYIGRTGWGE